MLDRPAGSYIDDGNGNLRRVVEPVSVQTQQTTEESLKEEENG